MTHRARVVVIALALIGAGLLAACRAGDDSTPSPTATGSGGEDTITQPARVETVAVQIMESFPVQVAVIAQGNHPDGCTTIADTQVAGPTDNTFTVTITATRPADQACTEALVPFEERVDLPVAGLPAGTYTVDVNGVTAMFTLQTDNVIPQGAASDAAQQVADCPQPQGERAAYVNARMGLCLLVPAGAEVQEPATIDNTIIIVGGIIDDSASEIVPALEIAVWASMAQGRGPAAYVDEVLAEAAEDLDVERTPATIGGQPAEIVAGMPGRTGTRQAWVVANETVYRLVLQPVDSAYPTATAGAEELWAAVMESLLFFPPDASAAQPDAPRGGWVEQRLDEVGVVLSTPPDWTVARGPAAYTLAPPDAEAAWMSVGVDAAAPLTIDDLIPYLEAQFAEQGSPAARAGRSAIGGHDAVVVTGRQDVCYEVYVPAHGVVRAIRISAAACNPDGSPTDTVINLLESVIIQAPVQG